MENNNSKQPRRKNKKRNMNYYYSYPRMVALSFFILIILGAFLLTLPISVKTGSVSFIDALFTATSATCVTGLIIFDTFTKWTLFGQIVILCLIQIGGLGFITIITMLTRFIKKKVSLREKLLLKESFGNIYTGDTKRLVRIVIFGTIICEVSGAAILCTQFIPQMGFKNGLYTSVFLSVSAFCNAGFDVLGRIEAGSSLVTVNTNPVILLTICALIIIGGIGFIVWEDIIEHKSKIRRYRLHTKLTLVTTAVLLIGGTLLYYIFESNNTLSDLSVGQKLLNAFFTSTTTRTAGFNSVPTGDLCPASKMITFILMFIGGSAGSTAGGIKTATVAVLFLCVIATLKNSRNIDAFGRRITIDTIRKAVAITLINFSEVLAASIIITVCQPELGYSNILFECFSAIGTVGLGIGITPMLEILPKCIIIALMFVGRITSLVFAFLFYLDINYKSSQKPKGTLLIG
ncbi:MAG: TrkH family potassium uptake protein [Eubacterium sp.]